MAVPMDKGLATISYRLDVVLLVEAEGHDSIQQTIEMASVTEYLSLSTYPFRMGKSASPQSLSQRLFF